jgi:shikimate dehydrogenase
MMPSGAARVAGVAGWPISHSLSPRLMSMWIAERGIDAVYAPLAIGPENPKSALRAMAKTSMTGLNITLPYKVDALAIADEATPAARAIGAANLLTFSNGVIRADNTDGIGFLSALRPAGLAFPEITALVLGAGGAARALVQALMSSGVGHIILANRSAAKAESLASDLAPQAEIIDWNDRSEALGRSHLVVNATSLGLNGKGTLGLDWHRSDVAKTVFDSVYTPLRTEFLDQAARQGHRTIDGLDMLIGQARPSFEAFFGVSAPEHLDVRGALMATLEARR